MLENLLKEFYDENPPVDSGSESIKNAVLSRVEKENHMRHFKIKPLIIAAAITATAAASVVTANAATDGAIVDGIVNLVTKNSAVPVQSVKHIDSAENAKGGFTEITYINGDKAYRADDEAGKYGEEAPDILSDESGDAYKSQYEKNPAFSEYLRSFFGNDNLPVDEKYQDDFGCSKLTGNYSCAVDSGTIAKSPVDGRVIAAGYNMSGLGNAVTVEFGGKTFTVCHLAEISVSAGDSVAAGQQLGICGATGKAVEPTITLIISGDNEN